jgi:ABC-type transport system substrate-binding protein
MNLRRLLIFLPALITVILLASYFWVPSYEAQTRGNPDRLIQFITASSGDAKYLNPVLASDSASSQINGMIFEGLIDRDENLNHRGRLAREWRIYEYAYFYINDRAATRRWGKVDAATLAAKLRQELGKHPDWRHLRAVNLLPPESSTQSHTLGQNEEAHPIEINIDAPARIRLTLDRVDQLLFDRLADLMGETYFTSFDPTTFVHFATELSSEQVQTIAKELLPATAHNPIIEFHLRPGVQFHDGQPVTAEDVRFTYNAIMNPKSISPRTPDYEPVQAVEVVDPLTVRITYKRLYSPALDSWSMGILPAHLLNDDALAAEAKAKGEDPEKFSLRQSSFNRRPVGCGPFVFQEWKSDQFIRLRRFEGYWEGAPNYKEYVMRIIADPLTQEMELYAGTIDDYTVQPHQVARLKKDERFQNFSGTAFGYHYIGYNQRRPPFDDPKVRRALGMAIDTGKIIQYVMYGQGESITGPFVKQTDYYNHQIPPLPYDPQAAVALLAEAGWRPGPDGYLQKDGKRLAFTLITNNGNPIRKAILAIAQDAWKKIGIQVETDLLEWSVFIEKRVNQLDFDALILGWSMGIDPDLFQIWHSSQSGKYQLNFVGFNNPAADDLILKIRQEYDLAQQVDYCRQLHAIIAAQQPYTFLFVNRWTALMDKRIVRKVAAADGTATHKAITPTKTGGYTFYFNQWVKLSHAPNFTQ